MRHLLPITNVCICLPVSVRELHNWSKSLSSLIVPFWWSYNSNHAAPKGRHEQSCVLMWHLSLSISVWSLATGCCVYLALYCCLESSSLFGNMSSCFISLFVIAEIFQFLQIINDTLPSGLKLETEPKGTNLPNLGSFSIAKFCPAWKSRLKVCSPVRRSDLGWEKS